MGFLHGSFPENGRYAAWSMLLLLAGCAPPRGSQVVIGAKNFTEQVVLGEMLAQEIEAVSDMGGWERRFYLAGSYLCQQALVSGRIDAYVEYTGTALTAILKQPLPAEERRDAVFRAGSVPLYDGRGFKVKVEPGLGFEDTFAIVVRGADAEAAGAATGSRTCRARTGELGGWGWGMSFRLGRMGWTGLQKAYGLEFGLAAC